MPVHRSPDDIKREFPIGSRVRHVLDGMHQGKVIEHKHVPADISGSEVMISVRWDNEPMTWHVPGILLRVKEQKGVQT